MEDDVAETDGYDSDLDPEFYLNPIHAETDVDYDEYSDGDISKDEVDALKDIEVVPGKYTF